MMRSGNLLWLVAVSYACCGKASATNASVIVEDTTRDECPRSFSEEFHSFIFVEECLAGMTSTEAGNFGCPVTVVENALGALFKESRVQNAASLPICFSAWFLLFHRGKVPTRASLFIMWILFQVVTAVLYILSTLAFVFACVNLFSWFHGCSMARFGSVQVPLLHVTLTPLAAFVPAGASKLVPTCLLINEHCAYHIETTETEHCSGGDAAVLVLSSCNIIWVLLLLYAALGLLYWMGTLSFLGSIACIGVSCPPFAVGALLGMGASTKRAECFLSAMGLSKGSEESHFQATVLCFCNLYLIAAPKIVFGSIVVWAAYSQHFEHSGEAVRAIYRYVFSFESFEMPSFVDFPEFFADPLALFYHLDNLPTFSTVPPDELLRGSTYFAVMGTVFGLLRTITINVPIWMNWAEGKELELADWDK